MFINSVHLEPLSDNGILLRLTPEDRAELEPHLEAVDLPLRRRVSFTDTPIEHVYFPTSGIVSIVTHVRRDVPIEIGIVGREGMTGLPALLGAGSAPNESFVQAAGAGWRIETARMREAMTHSPALTQLVLLFIHAFMMQTAFSVLANGRASLTERLARWLLMSQDRVGGDMLPLTHELLSIMLGVRRAGVSTALRDLEELGLVARNRGNIAIIDRDGLAEAADGYYGPPEREYDRLFGPTSSNPQ